MGQRKSRVQTSKGILVLVLMLSMSVPLSDAAPFYEQILTYFTEDDIGIGIYANLTYRPKSWYLDQYWSANFTIDIVLPANSSVNLNLTRFYVFLDFYDERVVYSLIDMSLGPIEANQSSRVVDRPLALLVELQMAEQEFIVEDYNSAYMGFLVVIEGSLHCELTNSTFGPLNLYSRVPEGEDWYQSLGPQRPHSNVDLIAIRRFGILEWSALILPWVFVTIFAFLGYMFAWIRFVSLRLLTRRERIAGRKVYLGGKKVALADLAFFVSGDLVPKATRIVARWAQRRLGIGLPDNLNPDCLGVAERRIWDEAERKLWMNTGDLAVSLVNSRPPGERGATLAEELKKRDLAPKLEDRSAFIELAEEYFVDLAARIEGTGQMQHEHEGIHRVVESTKNLVYGKLELLDPHLRELLEGLTEAPEKDSPVRWRTSGLTCRTIVQGFTESIVEQIMSNDQKPDDWKTIIKVEIILDWAKEKLAGHGTVEIQLLSNMLPYYQDYFKALEELVQKTGHKLMSKTTREEVNRCVMYTFLWLADMIQLLDRSGFVWGSAAHSDDA